MPDSPDRADALRRARETAVAYIGVSARTSGAVSGMLLRSGYPPDVVDETVAALAEDGYLRDDAVARAVVANASGKAAESRDALRARLHRRGVDREAAERALEKAPDDLASARTLLEERFGKEIEALSTDAEAFRLGMRMARFLASRGYGEDDTEEAVGLALGGRHGPG